MKKQFVLTLNYKKEDNDWGVVSHDVIVAEDLLSLLNQLNVLILMLHKLVLEDELK